MTDPEAPQPPELEPPAGLDVDALAARVDAALLGGERAYTRLDMAERSGMELEQIRRLWRAMGFATAEDDEQAFSELDVAALDNVRRLTEIAELDEEMLGAMTRIIGQSFARLASWQGQLVLEIVGRSPKLLESGDGLVDLVEALTPLVGQLHDYVWRRQLVAYFARVAANLSQAEDPTEQQMAVGFADMTAFTTFTRESSETELRAVLEAFESTAGAIVATHRGSIVKTIGDEVFFVADQPADAALIALDLVEAADADDRMPALRVGLASGPVISRLGDVFGATVNIASRLTSITRPSAVLVDRNMADALEGDERFVLRSKRPESVRGYHHLRQWRLRRAPSDAERRAPAADRRR